MTAQSSHHRKGLSDAFARSAITNAAKFWFAAVLVGQAIFAYYIVAFYYTATFNQDIEHFNSIMPAGYIEGDLWGNIAVVAHMIFAAIITIGGLMQLIPIIRQKLPALHRWNGRLYILVAFIMSLSGAFMILTRSDKIVGSTIGHTTIMINALIIMVCAILAFEHARRRQFAAHRRWALRLFIAVSGVWLFRVGLMAWLTFHGEPVGFDPRSFTGPFLTVLYTTVYVLPLLFLEVYLRAHANGTPQQKLFTAVGIILLTLVIILGVFGATMGMWLPRL
ncbi:DUF2306 domain-containing protein [uncultured Umboniibacter sp.]|uniref:DUF2306 domain-containing protein n=1 Tax=uncultured Umboniibacter sp. TaxID=1798917 RepID=UPI0026233F6C|nr:DUF2306 domain-containing protein [uncultured Umboniibacter sp.]